LQPPSIARQAVIRRWERRGLSERAFMPTQYDYYRELVKTRQGIEWNTLLVAEVANSLQSIHDEIEAVRRTTTAAMAIQQELLNREMIQAKLEEFIYQAERMVDEFAGANGSIDLST
jgi:hypothetical protein